MLTKVAKRLASDLEAFPSPGRPRLTHHKELVEFVGAAAEKAEAMGDSPRHSPGPNKDKKSSIPGSLSSLGMVTGTAKDAYDATPEGQQILRGKAEAKSKLLDH